jgi:hypothetical protein
MKAWLVKTFATIQSVAALLLMLIGVASLSPFNSVGFVMPLFGAALAILLPFWFLIIEPDDEPKGMLSNTDKTESKA